MEQSLIVSRPHHGVQILGQTHARFLNASLLAGDREFVRFEESVLFQACFLDHFHGVFQLAKQRRAIDFTVDLTRQSVVVAGLKP